MLRSVACAHAYIVLHAVERMCVRMQVCECVSLGMYVTNLCLLMDKFSYANENKPLNSMYGRHSLMKEKGGMSLLYPY